MQSTRLKVNESKRTCPVLRPVVQDEASFYQEFPNLTAGNHDLTSEPNGGYNCIAFAAGDRTRWYWPIPGVSPANRPSYWPQGCRRDVTIDAFVEMFETMGFARCNDGTFEAGVEKVAIFADPANGEPLHAAIQPTDRNGRWRSKMGHNVDIEHELTDVEGATNGTAQVFLRRVKRPIRNAATQG